MRKKLTYLSYIYLFIYLFIKISKLKTFEEPYIITRKIYLLPKKYLEQS